jgi:hypothetical protein
VTEPTDPRADFWRLIAEHENARACRIAAETRLAEAQRSTDSHRANEAKLRLQIEAWLGDGAPPAAEAAPSPEGAFEQPEVLAGRAAADARQGAERVPCTVCRRHPCECPPPAKRRPRGRKGAGAASGGTTSFTGSFVTIDASDDPSAPGAVRAPDVPREPPPVGVVLPTPPAREEGEGSEGTPAGGELFGPPATPTAQQEGR